MGIERNYKAYQGAKQALDLMVSLIQIPYTDLYGQVKGTFRSRWQYVWDQQINNKLHAIQPTLGVGFLREGIEEMS